MESKVGFFSWLTWFHQFDFGREKNAWILREETSVHRLVYHRIIFRESGHLKQTQKTTQVQASRSLWGFSSLVKYDDWPHKCTIFEANEERFELFVSWWNWPWKNSRKKLQTVPEKQAWQFYLEMPYPLSPFSTYYLGGDKQYGSWDACFLYYMARIEWSQLDSNGYPITWGLPPNRGNI